MTPIFILKAQLHNRYRDQFSLILYCFRTVFKAFERAKTGEGGAIKIIIRCGQEDKKSN